MNESSDAETLPGDLLAEGLQVVFVGYNPGRFSAARGHHFAGPGNYFWRLLYEAGFTDRLLHWTEDRAVLTYGIGLTHLVHRMTPGSADLSPAELQAGAEELRAKIRRYRPRAVCCLGKEIYRYYADRPRGPVEWGIQPGSVMPGVEDVVAPNPSRRSTVPYAVRLAVMRELKVLVDGTGPP